MRTPRAELALDTHLDELAARQPVPAGGAAAVVAAEQGLALACKVLRFSSPPDAFADALAALARDRAAARPLYDADCAAFEAVLAGRRAKDAAATTAAWREAVRVPLAVVAIAGPAAAALRELAPRVNGNLACDLEAAADLLDAAVRISWRNASANTGALPADDPLHAEVTAARPQA